MSLPNRLAAYEDCLDIFQRAIDSPRGSRTAFGTSSEGFVFQSRMHQARKLQRELNQRVFDRSDPQWGSSEYDKLIVRAPVQSDDGLWWVYIEPYGSNIVAIEDIEPELESVDVNPVSNPS